MVDLPAHILNRKPARRMIEIPAEVLEYLDAGLVETKNLVEWLSVDQGAILKVVLKNMKADKAYSSFGNALNDKGHNKIAKAIGRQFLAVFGADFRHTPDFQFMVTHPSDIVKEWACYIIGFHPKDKLDSKLELIYPMANDPNPGLREIAWFALRDQVAEELDTAIKLLKPWVKSKEENIRRYASEITRPRGVWCAHIGELKESPEKAFDLLHPLKRDSSRYVQNSVANWLNDASKTRPDWVREVCKDWEVGATKETEYIIKRALRTLNK